MSARAFTGTLTRALVLEQVLRIELSLSAWETYRRSVWGDLPEDRGSGCGP
jgi:hypothetical protein